MHSEKWFNSTLVLGMGTCVLSPNLASSRPCTFYLGIASRSLALVSTMLPNYRLGNRTIFAAASMVLGYVRTLIQ
jgi:hypothetical protein